MIMRRLAFSLALIALTAFAAPALANAPSKERVAQMLSGYEDTPTAAQWHALGSEVIPVLAQLYNDTAQPGFVRLRAVDAAGHFREPAARTFLLAVARAPEQHDLYVRAAVRALARAFQASSVEDIAPFLNSRHVVVRETVARELGRFQGDEVRALLEARLGSENNAVVREALTRSIARLR